MESTLVAVVVPSEAHAKQWAEEKNAAKVTSLKVVSSDKYMILHW